MERKHHKLRAWQQAVALVKSVYRASSGFPRDELYGITAQMRRAAVSVPANIAEGAARATDREFAHLLVVARGSLSELETHVIVAKELGLLAEEQALREEIDQVFMLVGGLLNSARVARGDDG
jgi:four helix bundle protein